MQQQPEEAITDFLRTQHRLLWWQLGHLLFNQIKTDITDSASCLGLTFKKKMSYITGHKIQKMISSKIAARMVCLWPLNIQMASDQNISCSEMWKKVRTCRLGFLCDSIKIILQCTTAREVLDPESAVPAHIAQHPQTSQQLTWHYRWNQM